MIKQVIVMRKDLNMRKGKMAAQAAHATLMSYIFLGRSEQHIEVVDKWVWDHGMTKIVVGAKDDNELGDLVGECYAAGIMCLPVVDAGKTEFSGPTLTCLCIGPDYEEKIDKITGHLKLL